MSKRGAGILRPEGSESKVAKVVRIMDPAEEQLQVNIHLQCNAENVCRS